MAYSLDEYKKRFDVLSSVYSFNFKPKKITQKSMGEVVREFYQFTPAQKAVITRLTDDRQAEKTTHGKYKKSHLYNVAYNVYEGAASFVKVKKSKHQKRKLNEFKKSGIFTTNAGLVIFSPSIEDVKIKKSGKKNYKIEYNVVPPPLKDKHAKRVASYKRKEIFVPIPLNIWRDEYLLDNFLNNLMIEYNPLYTRLAINGRQGKNRLDPKKIYHYITDNLLGNFVTDTPYVTGVYLIFKEKGRQI